MEASRHQSKEGTDTYIPFGPEVLMGEPCGSQGGVCISVPSVLSPWDVGPVQTLLCGICCVASQGDRVNH